MSDSALKSEKRDTASGSIPGCASNIRQLDRRDVALVRHGLCERYRCDVPEALAADLVAFIEELLDVA